MIHTRYAIIFTAMLIASTLMTACESQNDKSDTLRERDIRLERLPKSISLQVQEELNNRQEENKNKSKPGARGPAFIGHDELTWKQDIVTVSFEDGPEDAYFLIEQAANNWIDPEGYISFSFREENGTFRRWDRSNANTATDIRISFDDGIEDGGYWSVLGELALSIDANEATMNLEGFDTVLQSYYGGKNNWTESYERSTILHEFGHALGLAHEHFHPECQKDMRLKKLIKHVAKREGIRSVDARFNIEAEYYVDVLLADGKIENGPMESDHIDRDSIMLYEAYPKKYYRSGVKTICKPLNTIGYATSLSSGDREYFLSQYNNSN